MLEQRYFKLNKAASAKFIDAVHAHQTYMGVAVDIVKAEGFQPSSILYNSLGHVKGVAYKKCEIPEEVKPRLANIERDTRYITATFRRNKLNKELFTKLGELKPIDLQRTLAELIGVTCPFFVDAGSLYGITFGWLLYNETCYFTTKYPDKVKNCRPISNLTYQKIHNKVKV